MQQREYPVDQLLGALPDIPEVSLLREAILAVSVPDPAKAWAGSSAYATYDKRVLPAERLREAVEGAGAEARRRIERLYQGLAEVLEAAAADAPEGVVERLVARGEQAEAEERWTEATAYLELAARLGSPLNDRRPLSLALRRLARVRQRTGSFEDSAALYRASFEQAQLMGGADGQIVAAIGLGNVRSLQGRWAEAEAEYRKALELCGTENRPFLLQTYNNLSMVTREQGLLDEAGHWLALGRADWAHMSDASKSVWSNNLGLLHLARNQVEGAEAAFQEALEKAPSHFDRAMVLDNLAELAIRRGDFAEAEAAARNAEEQAIAAASPRALAEVYARLGKICRLKADPNGVSFFEKSLELCRHWHFPLTRAHAYLEYGLFRRGLGDLEEARAYFELACEGFGELGALADRERAARELAATDPRVAADSA